VFSQVQQVNHAEACKGSGLSREGFNCDVQVVGVVAVVLMVDRGREGIQEEASACR
jgi:hypothetical protein